MDYLEYKGYKGSVEYSKEDNSLCGKVKGIGNKALILYEGTTIDELRKDFEEGIDSYLEGCKADGIEPVKPFSSFVCHQIFMPVYLHLLQVLVLLLMISSTMLLSELEHDCAM